MPKRGALSMTMPAVASRRRGRRGGRGAARRPSPARVGRNVVNLAVGQHDDGADAVRRHVGERRLRAASNSWVPSTAIRGAAPASIGADLDAAELGEALREARCVAAAVTASRPSSFWLALLSTTSGDDRRQRLALLAQHDRVEKGENETPPATARGPGAAHPPEEAGNDRDAATMPTRRWPVTSGSGSERLEGDRPVHCPSRSRSAGTCTWSAL